MTPDGPPALERYRAKRDFAATPEPSGDEVPPAPAAAGKPRSLHARGSQSRSTTPGDCTGTSAWSATACWRRGRYPEGIPPDPSVNHLAVRTEDHPLMYLEFEGEIPKGSYGAGTMSVWDHGTYDTLKWESYEVQVVLHGERVQGRYVLFRTRDDQWMIHRMDPPQDPDRQPLPEGLAPMLATPGPLPADEAAYGFEVLWDGLRALAYAEGGRVRLEGDGVEDLGDTFPEVRPLGAALGATQVVLDGELVALGEGGRPDPDRLASRRGVESDAAAVRRAAERAPVAYMAYDLLFLDGHSTLDLPYAERRARLQGLGLVGAAWQVPAFHVGDGGALLELAREQGLPGVVAKRLDSPYVPGTRSPDWIEVRA